MTEHGRILRILQVTAIMRVVQLIGFATSLGVLTGTRTAQGSTIASGASLNAIPYAAVPACRLFGRGKISEGAPAAPGLYDSRLADRSMGTLSTANVRIFRYPPGLMHAEMFLIDDCGASLFSAVHCLQRRPTKL